MHNGLFAKSRYASGESCDWTTQISGSYPLSWSENFVSSTHNPRCMACFLYSLPNVDPGNVSSVFGNTPQFSLDFSADSGFLCNEEVLFRAEIKGKTYFFAACRVWLHLPISRPIRRTFFPEKCDLNSTCVLCAEGKYYFQTYKYPYIYHTTSLS